MSDEPIKLAPSDAPPLDDIILGDDEQTAPTPPVFVRGSNAAGSSADATRTDRRSRPASERTIHVAPEPTKDRERKRAKMTLRIPDDEVSRPQLPATTPMAGVQAIAAGRRPGSSSPDMDNEHALERHKRDYLAGASDADDTLELPPKAGQTNPARRASGIDASQESGWTPYQPAVAERANHDRDGARAAARIAETAAASEHARARAGAMREPARTIFDEPGMGATALMRQHEQSPSVPPPPSSEDIPVDTDDEEQGPRDVSGELATSPWLPNALDSDAEEIKVEDSERVTDPGAEDEVSPDDLVSVESIPTGSPHAPPLLKAPGKASTPPPVTATSLMAGVSGPGSAAAPLTLSEPPKAAPAAPAAARAPAPSTPGFELPAQVGSAARGAEPPEADVDPAPGTPMARRQQPAGGPFGFMQNAGGLGALAPPAMNESAAHRKKIRPWWEDLFNDDFIRTMAKITDGDIAREANFIEESLGCEAGATILDLACGTGRHAVELAARGYQVVGFDLSLAMLARASDEAQERKQKINFVQGDMREMTFEETFDGVYSWNTSFGFFDEEKNAAVIAKVHRALKKGGQFLLDVVNRDCIVRSAPSLAWFEGDGCICMDEMQIDFITSRMKVKRTLMMDDGRTKEIEYSIRVYSLHELGKMLHDNGFRVAEVSGRTGTPGAFFGCESPRTLILAEKR